MNKIEKRHVGLPPEFYVICFQLMAWLLLFFHNETYITLEFSKDLKFFGALIAMLFVSKIIIRKVSHGDNYIYLIVELLISIGLLMIYRLDPASGYKQGIWLVLSIIAFFSVYIFLKLFKYADKLFYPYIIISFTLFALTFILGNRIKGAINWIDLGIISFQPAELTKILLVFILASYYSNKDIVKLRGKERYNSYWEEYGGFFISIIVYLFIGLLFLQRDLGMSVIFFSILVSIQFIYEEDKRVLLMNAGLASIGLLLGLTRFNHVKVRIDAWLDPLKYVDGKGYQITQSAIAISEGGLFGTGVGLGYPKFIPAVKTDFIFSAICEEMGLFMGVAIVLLFLLLVYRGFKIALSTENAFLRIISIGLSAMMGFQTFIIIGGVTKMIPMTGITLPFVSYGGSSLLMSFITIGILQYVSEG